MKTVCVLGLGYVGLPLARQAHAAGYQVHGVDTNTQHLQMLRQNGEQFSSLGTNIPSKDVDIYIACVPTPINEDRSPDITYINAALETIGNSLKKGSMVIIESTVFPGYCEKAGRQILEAASGLIAGQDFFLAHCPERINPGDAVWNISNIPRVIGALDQPSAELTKQFYQNITTGSLTITQNMAEAEASKMIENAYRDINIAFVNELAMSFDGTNIDIYNTINAASTKPFGYMPFYPGMGVGGHCIPVDPHYLISAARERGFQHELLQLARDINDGMVEYIAKKIRNSIKDLNIKNPRIGLLGLTYKAGVADTRESQSIRLQHKLIQDGYTILAYDPILSTNELELGTVLASSDVVVLAVAHTEFKDIQSAINAHPSIVLVVDTTHTIKKEYLLTAMYSGVGQ